jgi:hypothetical protein
VDGLTVGLIVVGVLVALVLWQRFTRWLKYREMRDLADQIVYAHEDIQAMRASKDTDLHAEADYLESRNIERFERIKEISGKDSGTIDLS